MSDFERAFGAGADLDSIIDDLNRSIQDEQQTYEDENPPRPKHFRSFQEATIWAKNNPGKSIKSSPAGDGYIEVQRTAPHTLTGFNINILAEIKSAGIKA